MKSYSLCVDEENRNYFLRADNSPPSTGSWKIINHDNIPQNVEKIHDSTYWQKTSIVGISYERFNEIIIILDDIYSEDVVNTPLPPDSSFWILQSNEDPNMPTLNISDPTYKTRERNLENIYKLGQLLGEISELSIEESP